MMTERAWRCAGVFLGELLIFLYPACATMAILTGRIDKLRYVFEDFTLDMDRRELRRDGALAAVEPQVFDLLAHLICSRERVVSKDDLLAVRLFSPGRGPGGEGTWASEALAQYGLNTSPP